MSLIENERNWLSEQFDKSRVETKKDLQDVYKSFETKLEMIRTEGNEGRKILHENQTQITERIIKTEIHQKNCPAAIIKEHDSEIIILKEVAKAFKQSQKEAKEKEKETQSFLRGLIVKWGPPVIKLVILALFVLLLSKFNFLK